MLCYDAASITTHVVRHSLIHGSSFVLATLGTFLIHASAVCTNMFTGSVQQHFPVIDWKGA